VPEAERRCATCGRAQAQIGEDVTHRLAYVPAHFVEHEYHRPTYACGHCKDHVTTAPAPHSVAGCAADPSLLAHIVVSKFADHCPLQRLQGIYARSGAAIPRATLADWVAVVGDVVAPVVTALEARVRAATIVRTDATGLHVLDPSVAAHIVQGTMWGYVGDDRDVVFRYTPTGAGARGPWEYLAERTGYVQADAASVFDRLFTGQAATAIELGCWADGRRRLVALQATDGRATYPLQLIARLYRIEHLADAKQLTADARAALRRERSQPVLDKLHRWLVPALAAESPSSDFAKALGYLLNH
jgi:transposase